MRVGFVILCYRKAEMVELCVSSLLKIKEINFAKIVIVDNASPDETGIKIMDMYKDSNNIDVILKEKNTGYADGNNIGFKYAVEKLECDTIVVLNSDVIIIDENFLKKLYVSVQNNEKACIIAPDILEKKYGHVNPMDLNSLSKYSAFKNIIKNILANILLSIGVDYTKFRVKNNYNEKLVLPQSNFVPHGSCIVFTPKWTKNEGKAFCDKTFLFAEEYFLYAYLKEKNYRIILEPQLVVNHLGDGSIESKEKNDKSKRKFINCNQSKSLLSYIKFLNDPDSMW